MFSCPSLSLRIRCEKWGPKWGPHMGPEHGADAEPTEGEADGTLGPGRHADGGGLYLDREGEGRSRWLFMWTRAGKRREMGLGPAGRDGVSLAEARERAAKARQVVREGGDPIEAREAAAAGFERSHFVVRGCQVDFG